MHYEYLQLPESLAQKLNWENKSDYKGVISRYRLIRSYFKDYSPDRVINIGGNCGYFSLSLLDEGLIEEAVIYDIKPEILNIGRKMAEAMGLENRIEFIEKSVDLASLDDLPVAEGLIYQNVLHHAGDYFDEEQVKEIGWEAYAQKFLKKLRGKFQYGVLGMGFKWNKPWYWDVDKKERRNIFYELLKEAGWQVVSDVNVYSLIHHEGSFDYRQFEPEEVLLSEKSELANFWDLISFNIIKQICIWLGSKTKKLKNMIPGISGRAKEVARMYHLYLLE